MEKKRRKFDPRALVIVFALWGIAGWRSLGMETIGGGCEERMEDVETFGDYCRLRNLLIRWSDDENFRIDWWKCVFFIASAWINTEFGGSCMRKYGKLCLMTWIKSKYDHAGRIRTVWWHRIALRALHWTSIRAFDVLFFVKRRFSFWFTKIEKRFSLSARCDES